MDIPSGEELDRAVVLVGRVLAAGAELPPRWVDDTTQREILEFLTTTDNALSAWLAVMECCAKTAYIHASRCCGVDHEDFLDSIREAVDFWRTLGEAGELPMVDEEGM